MSVVDWLIPAHAGKTRLVAAVDRLRSAHPRSRGENVRGPQGQGVKRGSSPLTRGKPDNHGDQWRDRGLIPAHAGKTPWTASACPPSQAHPRSRGENSYRGKRDFDGRGSSPLTRGKPARASLSRSGLGLIPAHAGKTRSSAVTPTGWRAHPRSRGENALTMSIHVLADGSSPLTRGKPLIRVRLCSAGRLIPAHAGKTLSMLIDAWSPQAHPRSRGENQACSSSASAVVGSSPLTRGKLSGDRATKSDARLIPAHAGKTRPARPRG